MGNRAAFLAEGLQAAWDRMIGLVIEPGVGFDNSSVSTYRPHAAVPLVEFIDTVAKIVNAAHSTDYQTAQSLSKLVRDHFAILKFSPAPTYSVRRAFFALSQIEAEVVPACSEPVRIFVFASHTMNYWIGERYGKEARRRHLTRAAG